MGGGGEKGEGGGEEKREEGGEEGRRGLVVFL